MDTLVTKYKAVVASSGISLGKVYILESSHKNFPQYLIEKENIEQEIQRFLQAIEDTKKEIHNLKQQDISKNTYDIIDSYLLMIEDNELHAKVFSIIKNKLQNAEWAIYDAIQEYISLLTYSNQAYLREREYDLNEIISLLISSLVSDDKKNYFDLKEPSIIVTKSLLTYDFFRLPRENILGIVIEQGGVNSHVCLIAKSYGIPMLVGVYGVHQIVKNGEYLIIDANKGYLILNADETLQQQYHQYIQHEKIEALKILHEAEASKHKTIDSIPISFFINFELLEEIKENLISLSDGVGLLRTEFLFPISKSYHNEEQQFQTYMKVIQLMSGKPITIRTFDARGDKTQEYIHSYFEENPLMGFRGIRFTLFHKELMLSQLKAILKASYYGTIRILVPMISVLEEWHSFLELLEQAKTILDSNGIPYDKNIHIGPMIEVPSILYILEELAQSCDFWSVGSNDLLQFLLASDRTNTKLAYLYQSIQPSFLRVLRDIFYISYEHSIDISICGEIASDKIMIPLLLGAGLRNFSVSISQLPRVITYTTKMRVDDTRTLFEDVVCSKDINEVRKKVQDYLMQFN